MEAGLELCVDKGLSKVIIEGDSQIVLNGVSNRKFLNWKLIRWLPRINHLLESIGNYSLVHTLREGNKVVDFLANLGVKPKETIKMICPHDISEALYKIIQIDRHDPPHEGIGC
ncbi:hypothetical protein SUGI_0311430 [Cryptomeria japonica]|nr:hypothetical protein SUGI_0311430 [Cryptomeria japonica]